MVAGAVTGVLAAVFLRRRRAAAAGEPGADPRAEELREKLAEAREEAAVEKDFEAAGRGAETLVEEGEDVDVLRRRAHDDARAAADEMRRSGGPESA